MIKKNLLQKFSTDTIFVTDAKGNKKYGPTRKESINLVRQIFLHGSSDGNN